MLDKLSILGALGVLSFNFAALAEQEGNLQDEGNLQEKCYCVAGAGQNDCATSQHTCATLATKNFDCNDWKYVATDSCEAIGGSKIAGKSPAK